MANLKDLLVNGVIRCLSKVYASEFIGKLTGNADTATKATQDESGNNIKSSYASSISISDHTITLKNKNGTSLGTVTVPDNNTTYSTATTSANGLMSASDKSKLDGITASADAVSFTRTLSTGTKIGTITINGTGTDLYCQTNTDTNTWRGIQNNLTSTSTTESLSAKQGNVLKSLIDEKADYITQLSFSAGNSDCVCKIIDVKCLQTAFKINVSYTIKSTKYYKLPFCLDAECSVSGNMTSYISMPYNYYGDYHNTTSYIIKDSSGNTHVEVYVTVHSGETIYLYKDNTFGIGTDNVTYPMLEVPEYPGKGQLSLTRFCPSASYASKLYTDSMGSKTQPVYFSGGKPVACSYTLGKSVPSDAVFTDTNTWRPVTDNLTSTSTSNCLSANQGRVLKGLIDGKSDSYHTHSNYLENTGGYISCGGNGVSIDGDLDVAGIVNISDSAYISFGDDSYISCVKRITSGSKVTITIPRANHSQTAALLDDLNIAQWIEGYGKNVLNIYKSPTSWSVSWSANYASNSSVSFTPSSSSLTITILYSSGFSKSSTFLVIRYCPGLTTITVS